MPTNTPEMANVRRILGGVFNRRDGQIGKSRFYLPDPRASRHDVQSRLNSNNVRPCCGRIGVVLRISAQRGHLCSGFEDPRGLKSALRPRRVSSASW
jgi:hypothetical protein